MEANFSEIVKDIIQYSRVEALNNKDIEISSEHLMLGIIANGSQSITFKIFEYLDVDIKKLHSLIVSSLNSRKKGTLNKNQSIPLTKSAEKVLRITYLEAKILRSDLIDSFHLLLSILRDENLDVTKILKANFNITYESINALTLTPIYKGLLTIEHEHFSSKSSPLSLVFDTTEFSNNEIKDIILLLSDLYSQIGGDHLEIRGMSQFEQILNLA